MDKFHVPHTDLVTISREEIHIWRARIDMPASRLQTLKSYLDAEELKRAGKFHMEKDRDRYMAAHGALRSILSLYTGMEPARLSFCYGQGGKPELERECQKEGIRFNLSHSGGICVFAVTRENEVGVDIERIRRDIAVEEIADRFFSSRDSALLRSFPPELRPDAFFVWWTCREAYAKASGQDLSDVLRKLNFSFPLKKPSVIVGEQSQVWSLGTLSVSPGYAGAFVAQGEQKEKKCLDWSMTTDE